MAINIDCLVKLKLSSVKKIITEAIRTGEARAGKSKIKSPYVGEWETALAFFPDKMELVALITKGGKEIKQKIEVIEEDSNLRNGSKVYYFSCRGYKCRTLYSDGTGFYPRAAFRHIYGKQKQSRKEREIAYMAEPFRAYGKETYRGRLTPYGKRLQRYKEYETRVCNSFLKFIAKYQK